MSERQRTGKTAFVLEVGDRAVLVFPAGGPRQAMEFCAQDWFAAELRAYRSGGQPIWDGTSTPTIRRADACEAAKLDIALETELVRGEYDGYIFAFLVPVDAPTGWLAMTEKNPTPPQFAKPTPQPSSESGCGRCPRA